MATPSAEYWARRAESRLVEIERGTEPYLNQLLGDNQRAARQIRQDIDRIIGTFANNADLTRAEAMEILHGSITAAEKARILAECALVEDPATRARLMAKVNAPAYKARIDRLTAIEASAQARLAQIAPKQIETMTACLTEAGREMYLRTIFDIQRGTGAGFSFAQVTEAQISATLKHAWVGKHYKRSVWDNTEAVAKLVRETVADNMVTGRSWRRSLDEIEQYATKNSTYSASRLMRTETAYVANEMEAEAYEEAGLDEYEFMATLDGRTSEVCQTRDGKRFQVKDRQAGVNYPPMHPHCRSTTVAVVDGFDVSALQRRARHPETGERTTIPASLTYKKWRASL